jgi:EpsI family protein
MLLNYISYRRFLAIDSLNLDAPSLSEVSNAPQGQRKTRNVLMGLALILTLAIPGSALISKRNEVTVERKSFASFPLVVGDWMGNDSSIEPKILKALNFPDYIKADFRKASDEIPVNLYVAYYQSQRKGSSIHSPRSCIPGGGWQIKDLAQKAAGDITGEDLFKFNRLIIELGSQRQLVYYWFAQRGRIVTNEYLAKWYLFQDGITMQRSDGALVRLVTPVPEGSDIAEADDRLLDFLKDFYPLFPDYIPGA